MTSILNSIRRALADYSLRKFIRYAVVPSHWTQLFELRERAQLQSPRFLSRHSTWLKIEATSSQPSSSPPVVEGSNQARATRWSGLRFAAAGQIRRS